MQSAAGGTRTRTGFPPADFKSAASAISPQRLCKQRMYLNHLSMGSASRRLRWTNLANYLPKHFSLFPVSSPVGACYWPNNFV